MKIDEIEAFLTVAELASVSQAALVLNRTQPAITRRLQMLEQSLDSALFERDSHKMKLSAAGMVFLPFAEAAVASLRDGLRAVKYQGAQTAQSNIELAIVGTLADSHLVTALAAFEQTHPDAKVKIRTDTSRGVSDLVRRGEVELGIRYFSDKHPKLVCELLGTETLYLVVPKDHPVKAKKVNKLNRFAQDNWLSFAVERGQAESFGHLVESELEAAQIQRQQITLIDSLTAQKRLIQAGYGVTFMPMSSIREEVQAGSLRAISVSGMQNKLPVYLIRRQAQNNNHLTNKLIAGFSKSLSKNYSV